MKSPSDDSRRLIVKLELIPFIKGKLSLIFSTPSSRWDLRSSYAMRVDGSESFPSYAQLQQKPRLSTTTSTNFSSVLGERSTLSYNLQTTATMNIDVAKISSIISVRLIDLNKMPLSSEASLDVAAGFLNIGPMITEALKSCFDASRPSDVHSKLQSRLTLISINNKSLTMDVDVEASFTVVGINSTASSALSKAIRESSASFEGRNRIELGLRQAFIIADADNSGFVSFEEV